MSKFSNLYDIDGNIINKAPQHRFTLDETEELVDKLTKKVEENPGNEVYKVYLNNAQKWLFKLYNEMSREDLMKRLDLIKNTIEEAKNDAAESEQTMLEQINKAAEELKKEYDNESETTDTTTEESREPELDNEMERPLVVTSSVKTDSEQPVEIAPLEQADMLVERESDINMEEVIEA